jgi:hypothetical protein
MKTMYLAKHLWLAGLLLAGTNLAGLAEEADFSKKKELNQSFSVSPNDQLNVDNRYGSITVAHWDKNEVNIRVVIESKARNERRVQEELDKVQVELKKTANTVYAVTSIKNTAGWNNNSRITIDCYITMPSGLTATLAQKYGNINLPEKNEGKCNIELKYGNLKAGSFTESAVIDAGYGNITLENVKNLRMEVKYCGNVSLGNGDDIYIDSKYSRLKLHDVENLDIDNSYGNITAGNVSSFSIKTRYGNVNIDNVKEILEVNTLDYANLTVDKVDAGFKSIKATARYGTLQLSIPPQAAFQVSAQAMKYGNVRIKGLKMTSNTEDKEEHYYRINEGGNAWIRFNGNNYSNLRINAL